MRRLLPNGRALVVGLPLFWLLLFFAVPFLIVLKISLAETQVGSPPFTALFSMVEDHFVQVRVNLGNYLFLLTDSLYAVAYLNALKFAAVSTVLCLLLGYPMAYAIARAGPGWRPVLLMLVVMPFWTSFLIRIYAWIGILKEKGLINNALMSLHLIAEPLTILYTPTAVYIGIVYGYLPFMILPLYTALEKLDGALLEAAADLGARPMRTFLAITLPLSMRGVIAGSLLVFIPATRELSTAIFLVGANTRVISVMMLDLSENGSFETLAALGFFLLGVTIAIVLLGYRLLGRDFMLRRA